ncbi:hypothetical protein RFI_38712, partial [Reticulomyxa filosa]
FFFFFEVNYDYELCISRMETIYKNVIYTQCTKRGGVDDGKKKKNSVKWSLSNVSIDVRIDIYYNGHTTRLSRLGVEYELTRSVNMMAMVSNQSTSNETSVTNSSNNSSNTSSNTSSNNNNNNVNNNNNNSDVTSLFPIEELMNGTMFPSPKP